MMLPWEYTVISREHFSHALRYEEIQSRYLVQVFLTNVLRSGYLGKLKKNNSKDPSDLFLPYTTYNATLTLARFILETDHPSRRIIRREGSSV